jgi:dTMP kinase
MTAKLIILDGPDGVGKSLACKNLAEYLVTPKCVLEQSVTPWQVTVMDKVKVLRDPGSTPLGEELRKLLLDPKQKAEVATLFFGFLAARSELMAEIRKFLDHGYTVIVDRMWPSTVAYQGYGNGVPMELIRATTEWLLEKYIPSDQVIHYVFLKASPEIRRARLVGERGRDRFESADDGFRSRVDTGYEHAEALVPHISDHPFKKSSLYVGDLNPRQVVEAIFAELPLQWLEEIEEIR